MGYRIVSIKHRKIAAEGDGVIVIFNYRENKKVRIPYDLRQRIVDLRVR